MACRRACKDTTLQYTHVQLRAIRIAHLGGAQVFKHKEVEKSQCLYKRRQALFTRTEAEMQKAGVHVRHDA